MVDDMISQSKHAESGFYLDNLEELKETLIKVDTSHKKVLLIGFDNTYIDQKGLKEGDLLTQKNEDPNHFDPRYFKDKVKHTVQVIHDFENDKLNYRWEILAESTDLKDGGDFENRPTSVEFTVTSDKEGELKFKLSDKKGAYRLFGYVDDGHEHAATANIPFIIN